MSGRDVAGGNLIAQIAFQDKRKEIAASPFGRRRLAEGEPLPLSPSEPMFIRAGKGEGNNFYFRLGFE